MLYNNSEMTRFYLFALIVLVLLMGFLSYEIIKPFLTPIAWAIVFSIVFYPLFVFTLKYIKWKTIASLITLLVILVLILGPFSYLSYVLIKELKSLAEYLQNESIGSVQSILQHPTVRTIIDKVLSLLNITEDELNNTIISNIAGLGRELIGRITKGMGNIVTISLNFIFMTFSIFFFLRDGPEFLKKVRDYMPFSEEQKDRLVRLIRDIIISTIYGGIVVSIVQGTIAGIAFFFLGISTPVVWGLATSIASFVPPLGASLVWISITIYLFMEGAVLKGLTLAIIGIFGISLIDNILKPIIIGGRTKMPVLVIFFSIFGGIKLFGLIGLIMGPLVLALFVSLIEIFRSVEGGQNA
jgi:predicted PurR-regulated permease PerM